MHNYFQCDDLAPIRARISTARMVSNCMSSIYTGPEFMGLKLGTKVQVLALMGKVDLSETQLELMPQVADKIHRIKRKGTLKVSAV